MPPLLPGDQGQYRYVGCFRDNIPFRQLPHELLADDKLTNAACIAACAQGNYIFCATQYHRECWVGNQVSQQKVDDANCNFYCAGAINQICGGNGQGAGAGGSYMSMFADSLQWNGNWTRPSPPGPGGPLRLNVYRLRGSAPGTSSTTSSSWETSTGSATTGSPSTSTPTGPVVNETVGKYKFQGCWTEATDSRALTGSTFADDMMTLESCATFCNAFTYVGTEYGRECYCGNDLKDGSVRAENQNDCCFPCAGDKSEYCGAGVRIELYKLGDSPTGLNPSRFA